MRAVAARMREHVSLPGENEPVREFWSTPRDRRDRYQCCEMLAAPLGLIVRTEKGRRLYPWHLVESLDLAEEAALESPFTDAGASLGLANEESVDRLEKLRERGRKGAAARWAKQQAKDGSEPTEAA